MRSQKGIQPAATSTNRGARTKVNYGKLADGRKAWVQLPRFEAIVYQQPATLAEEDDPIEFPEAGLDLVRLVLFRNNRRAKFLLNLTSYTAAELDALRKIIEVAFDAAKPICEELDRRAKQAWEEGNDTHARIYRSVPEVVIRQRNESQHHPRLPSRPEGVVAVDAEPSRTSVGGSSEGIPERTSHSIEAPNDVP